MRTKKGFTLRTVCGENVLMAEGLETIDFGKLISEGTPEQVQNDDVVIKAYLGVSEDA